MATKARSKLQCHTKETIWNNTGGFLHGRTIKTDFKEIYVNMMNWMDKLMAEIFREPF